MAGTSRQTTIRALVDVAAIRTAMFNGTEHLVVPTVALMEGVIHPSNSAEPELVLAEELEIAPQGWNGRPVLPNHPTQNGAPISANDPQVLETQAFGQVFDSHMDGKKLLMEAWLNPAQAHKVGPLALAVLERARNREPIEVSVGCFVTTEAARGEYDGKTYGSIWRKIIPDHLAMLPEGVPGACSVEMGCGAPRAAQEGVMPKEGEKRTLRERLLDLMRFRSNAGVESDISDVNLRELLYEALRADEPGFDGISDVFPADGQVIYGVFLEERLTLYRRGYALADGKVTLGSEKEAVQPVTRYEVVTASQKPADCGCSGGASRAAGAAERNASMEKKERVKALIACPKTPYTDDDSAYLEGLSDERLTALEGHFQKLTVQTDVKPVEPPKAQTTEELLAAHPEIAAIVSEHKAAQAAKRQSALTALAGKQTAFTEAELGAMTTEQLEKLGKVIGVEQPVTFAGRALPRENAANDNVVDPPPSLAERLKARS